MTKAAVLWTGGKDCALACHEASLAGHEIALLVTFTGQDSRFRAHPLPVLREQADAMGVPHRVVTVGEPYDQAYRRAIRALAMTTASVCSCPVTSRRSAATPTGSASALRALASTS